MYELIGDQFLLILTGEDYWEDFGDQKKSIESPPRTGGRSGGKIREPRRRHNNPGLRHLRGENWKIF